MAEESSDQKAVFTSIKDSFFDDPFFKVRIRIIKWQFCYNVLNQVFIEKYKNYKHYIFLQFTGKCTFGHR